jgi:hypothetical protein
MSLNSPVEGAAVKHSILLVGVIVVFAIVARPVRADLISYSFTGTDSSMNRPVSGSFSYDTNVPGQDAVAGQTFFEDVHGNLTITGGGHTYSSNSVAGEVYLSGMTLFSDTGSSLLVVSLAAPDNGQVFSSIGSLPKTLNTSVLGASLFGVYVNPVFNSDGFIVKQGYRLQGPITGVEAVTIASATPEPGGLFLAALGAAVLVRRFKAAGASMP